MQFDWDSRREHKCLKHGQSEFVPWQLFLKLFGEIAGWTYKKQIISPRVAEGRTAKKDFYENLAWHFYHLAYLPMAFLPSGIFTNVIFTIWHFYHWHFYHMAYLPMAFLPSGIFTNDIFTIWHFYQWHFYLLAYLPMAFSPYGIFTNDIFTSRGAVLIFSWLRERSSAKSDVQTAVPSSCNERASFRTMTMFSFGIRTSFRPFEWFCSVWTPRTAVLFNYFLENLPTESLDEGSNVDFFFSLKVSTLEQIPSFLSLHQPASNEYRLRIFAILKGLAQAKIIKKNRWFYFGFLIWPYDVNMSID